MSFDNSVQNYFNSFDHLTGKDLEIVEKYFSDKVFNCQLDIATATGHFTKVFNSKKTYVLDLSFNMLKTAIKKYNIDLAVKSDSSFLPFQDNSFDLISCRIALHHFNKPQKFFNEVYRCLTNNGFFVLIDSIVDIDDAYLNFIELVRDNSHIRSYRVNEIIDFAVDFRLEYFFTQYKKHDFFEWASRLNQNEKQINIIEEKFKSLPENIQKELDLNFDNSKLISYTDKKGIFIFKKIL